MSGDLAEVALLQGPVLSEVAVGAIGGWNSSFIPRWYFLSQRDRFEMTDAEIRGGLDGLILAMNVVNYRNQAPAMRLSQLLDMYYSQRGVFTSNVRACSRRALFTEVAPVAQMETQTTAFGLVLDREMQLRFTLTDAAIQTVRVLQKKNIFMISEISFLEFFSLKKSILLLVFKCCCSVAVNLYS